MFLSVRSPWAQGVADPFGDERGSDENVCGGEPEHAPTQIGQLGLTVEIAHRSVLRAVVNAVVLHPEALAWIGEIKPRHDATPLVDGRKLHRRLGQAGEDQSQPQARLHRRLGLRVRELHDLVHLPTSTSAAVPIAHLQDLGWREAAPPRERIERNHGSYEWRPSGEVVRRSQRRCQAHTADAAHLVVVQRPTVRQ
jgi:hypothetical protein